MYAWSPERRSVEITRRKTARTLNALAKKLPGRWDSEEAQMVRGGYTYSQGISVHHLAVDIEAQRFIEGNHRSFAHYCLKKVMRTIVPVEDLSDSIRSRLGRVGEEEDNFVSLYTDRSYQIDEKGYIQEFRMIDAYMNAVDESKDEIDVLYTYPPDLSIEVKQKYDAFKEIVESDINHIKIGGIDLSTHYTRIHAMTQFLKCGEYSVDLINDTDVKGIKADTI